MGRLARSDSVLAWWRLLPAVIIIALLGVDLLYVKGPSWLFASSYPLRYTDQIAQTAQRQGVDPYWICAVIDQESGWDADARSDAGAVGLMQVLPATAREMASLGLVDGTTFLSDDLTDPATNIEYGTAYLAYLIGRYHEIEPAIAAYNAGLGNVDAWLSADGVFRENIEFPETRVYLLKTVHAEQAYEELYPDAFPDADAVADAVADR